MVFDALRGRSVLMGGVDASGSTLADVWEWDGSSWTQRTLATAPAPASRQLPGLAYDSGRGRTVLFGGHHDPGGGYLQETWELLARCARAGPGEVGGGGLALDCTTPPQLGSNFCVSYTTPAPIVGVQLLLIAVGSCASQPLIVPPPLGCAPSYLHPAP